MIHVCVVDVPNMPQILARFRSTNKLKKYGLPVQICDIKLCDNCGNDVFGKYSLATGVIIIGKLIDYARAQEAVRDRFIRNVVTKAMDRRSWGA